MEAIIVRGGPAEMISTLRNKKALVTLHNILMVYLISYYVTETSTILALFQMDHFSYLYQISSIICIMRCVEIDKYILQSCPNI